MQTERKDQQLKDFFHEHPLVIDEDQHNKNKETSCSACGEALLSGQSYRCRECEFHLHKKCAEAPVEIGHHPLHWEHPCLLLRKSGGFCDLCQEQGENFAYRCPFCDFSLDIKCALFSRRQNYLEFKFSAHLHPMLFVESHKDELKKFVCFSCEKPLVDPVYVCIDCRIFFHNKCAQLPTEINHLCHRLHPLTLRSYRIRFCKLCQNNHSGHFYCCSLCDFDIHIECVWPHHIIEDKTRHEHPFYLFWRQDSYICDACGTEGSNLSYVCSTCHLQVHKKCTSLPRILKISRHEHFVFHKYSNQEKEFEKQDCRICFGEVKREYGCYRCLKQDCNYVVHVNCATEHKHLYYIVDSENQEEPIEDSIEPSITLVIEVNECGEATKIKHFSHEHNLTLADNIGEEDDKHCDGCALSILDSFYYCSQCNFLLHRTCAELPMKKYHWFDIHQQILKSNHIFECEGCYHQCSGFSYYCDECELSLCLQCARISDTLEYPGHEHPLFCDLNHAGRCTTCRHRLSRAYRCKKCDYALDFECITLPGVVRHQYDKHLLKLSYNRDESKDPERYYCDICEEKRDPNDWFYLCSICDNSVHLKCVLGKYPYIKTGSTYRYKRHPHLLTFVRKIPEPIVRTIPHPPTFKRVTSYYPDCVECGRACKDLALECSICNYIVHWDCVSPFRLGVFWYQI